jgi:hypothetical protein
VGVVTACCRHCFLSVAAFTVVSGAAMAAAAASLEYEVKAAFLFNFAKFVEWPPSEQGALLELCVLGEDPFGEVLDSLEGREIQGRALHIRRLHDAGERAGCHILFVSVSESSRLDALIAEVAGDSGLLAVSDIRGFAGRGGAIELFLDGNRVRFAVNRSAALRTGLVLSSRLLQLAVIVE